ncbi:SAGA complex subunit Sgf73 [Elasticomyces elasticus]|nr:SAGA complex subunit Sgf73 [Elasticomyces elasticus]
MAPNGSRKSELISVPFLQGCDYRRMSNLSAAPAAPSKRPPSQQPREWKPAGLDRMIREELGEDASKQVTRIKESVQKKIPKLKDPGNWNSEIVGETPPLTPSPKNSRMNRIPSSVAKAFPTNRPMDDKLDIRKCNHCKRPIPAHRLETHIEACLAKKQEKQRKKKEAKDAKDAAARKEREGDKDSETPGVEPNGVDDNASVVGDTSKSKSSKKTAVIDSASKGKKRKADDAPSSEPKKKKNKKDEPKVKLPRPKAPVDVEKQCGVELPQGGQCARSLTCKSHSMGAKRSVPGRSRRYDQLLAEYQRKNQAKLQKQALESNAAPLDELDGPSGAIDSDEEKELIMAAIARSQPQPIVSRPLVPLRRKYQMVRIKEMLGSALAGRNGMGLFSIGDGGGGAGLGLSGAHSGAGGDSDSRRGSVVPGSQRFGAGAPQSRKASVSAIPVA